MDVFYLVSLPCQPHDLRGLGYALESCSCLLYSWYQYQQASSYQKIGALFL